MVRGTLAVLVALTVVVAGPAGSGTAARAEQTVRDEAEQRRQLYDALGVDGLIEVMRREGAVYGDGIGAEFLGDSGAEGWAAVVARIYDPGRAEVYQRLGITTVATVKWTADQILRTGQAEYPVIGAKVRTGTQVDSDGAEIDSVMPDTPADRSGLEKGDVITEVDGERVSDGIALIVAIRAHQPGEAVEFTILRDGEQRTITMTLGSETG